MRKSGLLIGLFILLFGVLLPYTEAIACETLDTKFQETLLTNGMQYYTDRTYTLTSVPAQYVGLDTIKTPNNERKSQQNIGYLIFEMPMDGNVYVAFDSRASSLPSWMDKFEYTGYHVRTSLGSQPFLKIYSKAFSAGDCVNLGGNYGPGSSTENRSNYMVFYGTPSCILDTKFQKTLLTNRMQYYTDPPTG